MTCTGSRVEGIDFRIFLSASKMVGNFLAVDRAMLKRVSAKLSQNEYRSIRDNNRIVLRLKLFRKKILPT